MQETPTDDGPALAGSWTMVPFGEELWIPDRFQTNMPTRVKGVQAKMTVEVVDGRLRCTNLAFHCRTPDAEIPSSILREFHVGKEMGKAAYSLVVTSPDGQPGIDQWMDGSDESTVIPLAFASSQHQEQADQAVRRRRRRKITPAFLQEVADVYLANDDGAPTKAVAEQLFASHSTAATWVGKARAAGLIPPPDRTDSTTEDEN